MQNIPETLENVKIVWDKLNLGPMKVNDFLASDFKLINIITGIQGHQSSYPCPYCHWLKKDGFVGEASKRTYGSNRWNIFNIYIY